MAVAQQSAGDLKAEFMNTFGMWDESWSVLLNTTPSFFAAYTKFASTAWRTNHLEPKVREFLLIATSSSTTQLHRPAIAAHIRNALRLGATADEIVEVLQLTSVLGIHSCAIGVPILIDEARQRGLAGNLEAAAVDPARVKLKEEFIAARGFWTDFWEGVLALSPSFFTSYLEMSSLPWIQGKLSPKVKEFIYIAIDAATTHLHEPGLRVHVQNAFKHGATSEEIMDVFEVISTIGIYSCTVGLPLLLDALADGAAGQSYSPPETL